MTLKRDPSKALAVGFVGLLLVSTVQVGYWIYDHVQNERDVERRFAVEYQREADAATAFYSDGTADEIAARLPHVAFTGPQATVRPEALAELGDVRASRINRFMWEGGFFLAVLLAGIAVLTRTIRHDAELRRRQQNFLAAVSHEFKSPLASIQLASETLVLRSRENDTQRLGSRILEDCERLLRMIDNLLDTTRLEEGRQQLAATVVSVLGAATSSVAEIAERARLSSIDVTLAVPADLKLSVDPAVLETALRNLLDNAVKSCVAGHGRSVTVRAAHAAGAVEIAVSDDGIGFPPEEAAMIFEKFYRIGDELRRSMPGTGLGLYIVKRLVELAGGTIGAHSDGPGRGATVTMRWPERGS